MTSTTTKPITIKTIADARQLVAAAKAQPAIDRRTLEDARQASPAATCHRLTILKHENRI